MLYFIISYYIILCDIILYYILQYNIKSRYIILYHISRRCDSMELYLILYGKCNIIHMLTKKSTVFNQQLQICSF